MAAWLAARGHDVRVVTAPPYYPAWAVSPGFANAYGTAPMPGVQGVRGVQVHRCPLWVPPQPGGAKAWLHVQDFEVDAAFDLGLLKGQRIRNAVAAAERWLMRRFDVVSTISERMHQRLLAKGVDAAKAKMAVNWVDMTQFGKPSADGVAAYRQELNIPAGAAVALYSGNMGGKQGLAVLAEAAKLSAKMAVQPIDSAGAAHNNVANATEGFSEAKRSAQVKGGGQRPGDTEQNAAPARGLIPNPVSPEVFYVFCGNGAGRADLLARCTGLTNVRFIDLQPAERLPDLLATADIHLLPQRADAADLVMPSKLTVVQSCGLVVPPEDPAALAQAIHTLAANPALSERLGAAGFVYAQAHLDREAVLERFEADVKELLRF